MSLFSTAAKPGGLFGSSTTTTTQQQPQQTGGLFGSSTAQQPAAAGGGLFGASTAQQPQTGGLFGASTAQKPAGLFGASTQQPAQAGGLFGPTAQQPAQSTGGLFGASTQQPTNTGGLFGSSQQPSQSTGLFSQSAAQPGQPRGLFGVNASQQRPQEGSLAQSFLAGSQAAPLPRLGQSQWMTQPNPREKPIQTQMTEILMKWHPNSPTCAFQHYFYQNVGADRAPYYGVPDSEDPVKWEEALKQKPSEGSIPVLARGFGEIGIAGRIKLQDAAMKALYERVREIDSSLGQRIEEHDLKFTVRTQEARRRHVALSRRCLALATKVQVLRNRGYALDAAEEELKAKLARLEKETFDPVVGGRQEELWARMTVVRERARMLKEETERLGRKAGEIEEASRIDEGTMGKIRQILTDYDAQLAHLRKELELIKTEFENWAANEKPGQGGASKR